MSALSYLRWLRKNWAWVGVPTLVGIILAMAFSLLVTPRYVATSEMFLSTPRFGNVSLPADSPFLADGFAQQRARSYIQLASRVDLARRVVDKLGIDQRPEDLASAISAWTPPDTVLIDVSVKSSSPTEAKILADAVTAELAADIRKLESRSGQILPVVEPVVTTPAETPTRPSEPQIAVFLLFGASGGFLVGVTAAAVQQRRRIEVTELEHITGKPVLGEIFSGSTTSEGPVERVPATSNRVRWQWNEVLTNLAVEIDRTGDRVLVVTTGSGSGRGSGAAAGLASSCANSGSRVALLLLHQDLPLKQSYQRVPEVALPKQANAPRHRSDQDRRGIGVADLIAGETSLVDAIQPTDNQNLYFIAGPEIDNVAPLLQSDKFYEIIEELREAFDIIIVDAPEFLQLTSSTPLPRAIDSVILVVEEEDVDKHDLAAAVRLLAEKELHLLGSILQSYSLENSQGRTHRSLVTSHEGLDR